MDGGQTVRSSDSSPGHGAGRGGGACAPRRPRAQPPGANYDEAKVPAYTLPDPLRFADGTPRARRAATGRETPRRGPAALRGARLRAQPRRRRRRCGPSSSRPTRAPSAASPRGGRCGCSSTAPTHGPAFEILLYVPNAASRPVPAFLGLNFDGNHAVHPDPASGSRPPGCDEGPGVVDHRATEAGRGTSAAASWPVERILDRGYALATVYYGDLEPDHADGWKDGVALRLGPGATRPLRAPTTGGRSAPGPGA